MRIYDIIAKKRDGEKLSKKEIDFFIDKYTSGEIEDYQASALLMAIYINGMNEEETINLTKAMSDSGDKFHLGNIGKAKVDKHSTGGVGDSVTLVLGPLVAQCGVPFAKMSGRGLGHTGGTLDKLAAFEGLNLNLSDEEFKENILEIGIAIAGQTKSIAPADGKIYALRDVTATVDNISLIASSIMSKKLAIDSYGIVLDIKVGSGAFMKNVEDATLLAEEMVKIGKGDNRETVAVLTNMDEPLGLAIGNDLEVIEALEVLKGKGPEDLREICIALGVEILILGKITGDKEEARKILIETLDNGLALNKLKEMIALQDGDIKCIDDYSLLKQPKYTFEVKSEKEGYVAEINAENIGKIALILGAGRETKDSEIDLSAGILLNKKVDDFVEKGELIATLYTDKEEVLRECEKQILDTYKISDKLENKKKDLILNIIK